MMVRANAVLDARRCEKPEISSDPRRSATRGRDQRLPLVGTPVAPGRIPEKNPFVASFQNSTAKTFPNAPVITSVRE